ncbi:hypothetical protein HDU78_008399 [Chytriomyces hyalinus]|nr:hypothetical protein HDU78_008399 [Chytriomyces hyalinus]
MTLDPSTTAPKPLHSQCSNKPFADAQALMEMRVSKFNSNVARALEAMDEEMAADPSYVKPYETAFVSLQDQLLVCKVYETKISVYIKAFKLDEAVHATSVSLFKRFYLHQSIFNHDPRIILITCIFLAAKAENSYIPLSDFLLKVPQSSRPEKEAVWEKELIVADTVGFAFTVQHVHWPLHGLFLDLQTFYATKYPQLDQRKTALNSLARIYARARELSQIATCTDLQLTHWGSQIALGCFLLASTEQGQNARSDFEQYLSFRISWVDTDTLVGLHEKLGQVTDAIKAQKEFEEMAKDANSLVSLKRKEINSKLAGCLNPEFLPDSKLHAKRKKQEEEKKEAKRLKKVQKETEHMNVNAIQNPFE